MRARTTAISLRNSAVSVPLNGTFSNPLRYFLLSAHARFDVLHATYGAQTWMREKGSTSLILPPNNPEIFWITQILISKQLRHNLL